jgi:hypothetical protein
MVDGCTAKNVSPPIKNDFGAILSAGGYLQSITIIPIIITTAIHADHMT